MAGWGSPSRIASSSPARRVLGPRAGRPGAGRSSVLAGGEQVHQGRRLHPGGGGGGAGFRRPLGQGRPGTRNSRRSCPPGPGGRPAAFPPRPGPAPPAGRRCRPRTAPGPRTGPAVPPGRRRRSPGPGPGAPRAPGPRAPGGHRAGVPQPAAGPVVPEGVEGLRGAVPRRQGQQQPAGRPGLAQGLEQLAQLPGHAPACARRWPCPAPRRPPAAGTAPAAHLRHRSGPRPRRWPAGAGPGPCARLSQLPEPRPMAPRPARARGCGLPGRRRGAGWPGAAGSCRPASRGRSRNTAHRPRRPWGMCGR